MKWVAVPVLMLVAIVAGVYAALPWILPALIVQEAAARGILVSELQMQWPALDSAVVDRISLRIGANEVQAEGVLVRYSLASLSLGAATNVEIARIVVAVRPDDSPDEQPLAIGELLETLPGLLSGAWELVPAQMLIAPDVRVHFADMKFSGALEFSQTRASLAGRLDGPQFLPALRIAIEVEPGGALRAGVHDVAAPDSGLVLRADLAAARGTVAGSWSLAREIGGEMLGARLAGATSFALAATGWSLGSGLVVDVETGDWHGVLEVSGAEGSWQVEPAPTARISGNWRGSLGLDRDSATGHGGVSIAVGADEIQLELEPATVVEATGLGGDDWSIAGTRVALNDRARLRIAMDPLAYRLESPMGSTVKLDGLVWAEYRLSPLIDLTLDRFAGDLESVDAAWQVAVADLQLTGSGRVSGGLTAGPYALEFKTLQQVVRPFLATALPAKGRDYDLDRGRIESQGKLALNESGLTGAVSVTLADLAGHYGEITVADLDSELAIAISADEIQLELEPATVVEATGLGGDDWSIAGTRVALNDGARLRIAMDPLAYRLESPMGSTVKLDGLVWAEYRLSPLIDLTLDRFAGDLESVDAAWQVAVADLQLTGSGRVSGGLTAGPYALEFKTLQQVVRPFLATALPAKGRDYDLDRGRIESQGKLALNESGVTGAVSVTLADLAGHYEEITVADVDSELAIAIEPGTWRAGPGRIAAALIDVGFPISDVQASVIVTPEHVQVSEFAGRTLGGELRAAAVQYEIASGSSEFPLEVIGIQLGDVLALEGDSVTGSGVLDGSLPLQIKDNQVRVSEGRFRARAPGGTLRFGDAEQAASSLNQMGVGFAIAALSDYHYSVMDVDVTYEVNGDLLLGVHLEGRNPKFEAGRPIHYNLNVSENIPVLLESLQLSDEVSKRLEQRLKKPPERRSTQ